MNIKIVRKRGFPLLSMMLILLCMLSALMLPVSAAGDIIEILPRIAVSASVKINNYQTFIFYHHVARMVIAMN